MRFAFALPMMLILVATSHAGEIPDARRLGLLRADAEQWNRFRVFATHGRHDLKSLRADSAGVVIGEPQGRSAIVADPNLAPEQPKRLHWAEIEKIDGTRSHALLGFAEGALVGTLVGVTLVSIAQSHSDGESGAAAIAVVPIGILIGGFIGAAIGSSSGWKPLYP